MLTFLKKWIFRLFLLLVAVFAVIAAADNSQAVPLSFLGYESWALPVSHWVLIAFVFGVVFGMATNLWSNTRLRMSARQSSKAAAANARALDEARAQPARAASLPALADDSVSTS